jgi:hypothetical protein
MIPIQVDTSYSWQGNRLVITDYKTKTFDNGLQLQTVERRSYQVTLYSSTGELVQHTNKGNAVDKMA